MIKSIGLLQCREDLGAGHFREHYEQKHAPMARELLGLQGYLRNYPESADARRELGVAGVTEFWFQDAAEIARIGALMQGEVGAQLMEDERRFMNVAANQSYNVRERRHGLRPAPGEAVRAIAIQRLPVGARAGERDRRLDHSDSRVRERRIPGVIAALYSVPEQASMPLPPGLPGIGCIESLWLEDREVLAACNDWRAKQGAVPLSVVEESGDAVLDWPH